MARNNKTHIVAVVGDLHGNCTVALSPPSFTLDDGGTKYASRYQMWLWEKWTEFWAEVGKEKKRRRAKLTVVVNGEIVDDNKHSKTQLMTQNRADMMRLAEKIMRPALSVMGRSDNLIVLRGTEAHTGPSANLDEEVARDLGAVPSVVDDGEIVCSSWWNFRGRFNGVLFDIAHHAGTGHRLPWTKGNDANRLAARMVLQSVNFNAPIPDLVIRGHNHRDSDSFDNQRARAIIMPSWQLGTSFGFRIGGDWLSAGGLYVVCEPGGRYEVHKRYHDWPITDVWEEEDD